MKRLQDIGLVLAAVCAIWAAIGGLAGNGALVFTAMGAGVVALAVLAVSAAAPPRNNPGLRETERERRNGRI